ncbi:MAG: hypothetical protein COU33_03715 [Candidatus Magasanikbacteria bacterium CG10_big_fil_rev_8_21_14_0_10_43_6]|uniref:O-antigen ligase-related domain-containing protein n=1 Tax=Candidatus Magasanikbacteria bacterium CG10_big_fil_rev_8_21_14_0_10_43_6 TaxID=1974650 RepID=A0A2M6W0P4_9BACT|nr:MAG: hypothetical protein COU33_03715 [Candidatus Magasanikbacteria bacterium CG10_big_fil_rev_8_21_14_0_10_43_6]
MASQCFLVVFMYMMGNSIFFEKSTAWLLRIFLFVVPWPTIWIYREVFLNGYKWEYGTLGLYASEVLLWLVVLCFLALFWQRYLARHTREGWTFSRDRICVFTCMCFVLYTLASSIWALDAAVAWQRGLHSMAGVLLFLILYLGPLRPKDAAHWFVFGMLIQSCLAIYQFVSQSTFGYKWLGLVEHVAAHGGTSVVVSGTERWLRAYGAFPHPNMLGGFLVVSLAVTCAIRHVSPKAYPAWVFQVALAVQYTALVCSGSRSAWVSACIVTLFVMYLWVKDARRRTLYMKDMILVILLLISLGIVFFPFISTRVLGGSSYEVRSVVERMDGYATSVSFIRQHPVLGVGAGNYTAALHATNPDFPGWVYQPVHAVPLLLLGELGIVGILLLSCVCVAVVRMFFPEKFFAKRRMFLVAVLPMFLFDHYLFSSYQGIVLVALLLYFFTVFTHRIST